MLLSCGALLLVNVWMAYSRSALAAAVLLLVRAALVAPVSRRARVSMAGAVLAAAIAVAATPTNRAYLHDLLSTGGGTSVGDRTQSIIDGFHAMIDRPVEGIGFGQYVEFNGYLPAHSSVAQAGAEMGLMGFAAFTALTVGAAWLALLSWRRDHFRGPAASAALGAGLYLAYSLVAAGSNEAIYSGYNPVWAFGLALLLSIALAEYGRLSRSSWNLRWRFSRLVRCRWQRGECESVHPRRGEPP